MTAQYFPAKNISEIDKVGLPAECRGGGIGDVCQNIVCYSTAVHQKLIIKPQFMYK